MALYEVTFLTKEESDPGVRAAIEAANGAIQAESSMGRKRLAYPINKETQAVYTTFVFDAAPTAIAGIDRKLRLNTGVIRHLIVTKETAKADKEVSKTVREAIAAAEKLEDAVEEKPVKVEAVVIEPVVEETAEETPEEVAVPAEETAAEAKEEAEVAAEVVETPEVETAEEEKPAKKTRAKKAENAADVTEEDRLKALEDKLGEILKD